MLSHVSHCQRVRGLLLFVGISVSFLGSAQTLNSHPGRVGKPLRDSQHDLRVVIDDLTPGEDICAKILAACSRKRTIDMRNITGTRACSVEPMSRCSGDTVLLGAVKIDSTVIWVPPSNFTLVGQGANKTVVHFHPSSNVDDALLISRVSNVDLGHIAVVGSSNTARCVSVVTSSNVRLHDIKVSGCVGTPSSGPSAGIAVNADAKDIWVVDDVMTANGPDPISQTSYDFVVWQSSPSTRVHVIRPMVYGSNTAVSLQFYDCLQCELVKPIVDENSKIFVPNSGGYGVSVYASRVYPLDFRLIGGRITNTAGAGVYLADADRVVVSGTTLTNTGLKELDSSLPVGAVALNGCSQCDIGPLLVNNARKDAVAISAGDHTVRGTSIHDVSARNVGQYCVNFRGTIVGTAQVSKITCDNATEGIHAGGSLNDVQLHRININNPAGHGWNVASATNSDFDHIKVTGLSAGFTGGIIGAGAFNRLNQNTVIGSTAANSQNGLLIVSDNTVVFGSTINNLSRRSGVTISLSGKNSVVAGSHVDHVWKALNIGETSNTYGAENAATSTGVSDISAVGTVQKSLLEYSAKVSPAAVAARGCAMQSFTNVVGIHRSDFLVAVSTERSSSVLIFAGEVTATGALTAKFCNLSGSPVAPTALAPYKFLVLR